MSKHVLKNISVFIALFLAGCGSGGDKAINQQQIVISFSLLSTARPLPFRLSTVQVDAELPGGVAPITGDVLYPRKITSGLHAGGSVAGPMTSDLSVFGTYSAPHVRLIVTGITSGLPEINPGEMFRLSCNVDVATHISEVLQQRLLNSVTFDARGYDPNALLTNPNSLNEFLKAMVTVRTGS